MSVTLAPRSDVVTTAELDVRPSRTPEHAAEIRALVTLARTMASSPNTVLQQVADLALELCRADSAGVSLTETNETGSVCRWHATAGRFASYVGETLPRDFSPCGMALDERGTLLMREPCRLYPYIAEMAPPIHEVLVVPFFREDEAIGTLWVVSHSPHPRFDGEDARLVSNLVQFAAAAVQIRSNLARTEAANRALQQHHEANAKFEVFFEQGVQFAAVLSLEGVVVEVNRSAMEGCGFSREDVLGRPFWDCGWWSPSAALQEQVRSAASLAASGRLFRAEVPYYVADGTERVADLVLAPVTEEDGRVLFVAATGTDVTHRKLADQALREAHSRIASTLAAAEVSTWIWDIHADRLHGDRNLLRLFSIPFDENDAPLHRFLDVVHPDDVEQVTQQIQHAAVAGVPFEAEFRVRRPDGGYRHVVGRGRVEYDDDQPARMPGVILDITRQKRAEEDLAQLLAGEQRRTHLLRSVANASRSLNASLSVESITRTMAEEARSLIGARRAVVTLAGVDDWRREQTAITVDEGQGEPGPANPDGSHDLTVPLSGHLGQTLGTVNLVDKVGGAFTPDDEAVLVQLAAIASVGIENARLYEQLRDQDTRKDEFLATLAHELRNPLAPMWNALSVLRRAGLANRALPIIQMMDRQLAHFSRLVDDLLDMSRVTSGRIVLRKERVDIRSVVDAAVETTRPVFEELQHVLTVQIPDECLPIEADSVRIAQVLTNLIDNAAKYTPAGGRIDVLAAREGSELVIRVRDTGVGISGEMLSRVFDMFTQIGASLERSQGGLGIGLTLVRKLVEMHGGRVAAESAGSGRGSTFVVRLPLACVSPRDAPDLEEPPIGTPPTRRVLVVDDNRDTAHSLALLLELDGHRTLTAYDGPGALDAARELHPEVVLLDIGLPGMTGYEVAERLRKEPEGGGMVLIAVTGWGADEDRERSRAAGFDHHLVKPVDPDCVARLVASSTRAIDLQEH